MNVRGWLEIVLVLGVLFSGWSYMRASAARDAAIARAEASDSVAAERTQEALEATERAVRDSARAARALTSQRRANARADSLSRVLGRQVSEASARAVEAGEGLLQTLDSIEVVLAPPHEPLADVARAQARDMIEGRESIERAFREQQAEFQRFRQTTDSTISAVVESRDSEREAKERWRETALAERQAKEQWRDVAQPGFFGRIAQNVPLVVGSVGVGALACLVACP